MLLFTYLDVFFVDGRPFARVPHRSTTSPTLIARPLQLPKQEMCHCQLEPLNGDKTRRCIDRPIDRSLKQVAKQALNRPRTRGQQNNIYYYPFQPSARLWSLGLD